MKVTGGIGKNISQIMNRLINKLIFVGLLLAFLMACSASVDSSDRNSDELGPIKVDVREENGRYSLYRGGEPYVVKGAGLTGNINSLKAHGGNSFRTWSIDTEEETGQEVLDKALANDMTVAFCFYIQPERHGMDYNDAEKVEAQFQRVKKQVMKYKDHPALLMWVIGNELNYDYTNPKVYDAVNEISKFIHEVDPYHPTTSTITVLDKKLADDIRSRAPDLDVLSMQLYGAIFNLPRYIEEAGWTGPYMVTEWGAIGHWEMANTDWGAPIEQSSSGKAQSYLRAYKNSIEPFDDQCIGNYVFLWGQKQERTPTWYGLFLNSGEETEPTDVMHYIWNNEWPENRTPRVDSMKLDGKIPEDNIYLTPGQQYSAIAYLFDYEGDNLEYKWEIMRESMEKKEGGDKEEVPETLTGLISNGSQNEILLNAPDEEGPYRLFMYAFDGNDNAAHANIPFYVK